MLTTFVNMTFCEINRVNFQMRCKFYIFAQNIELHKILHSQNDTRNTYRRL